MKGGLARRVSAAAARLTLCGSAVVGCAVGQGTGQVSGTLQVDRCRSGSGGTYIPISGAWDLQADFFVGQPIDADLITAPTFPANQMIIRVQHSGNRIESANSLLFFLRDSAAVARCVHGAPGWDPALCDRSAGALGPGMEGRLLVGMTSETARGFFALNDTCPNALVSADALGVACENDSCPDLALCPGRGSWIIFADYGNVPADPTVAIPDGFRVNDGERMRALSFHLELCDAGTVLDTLDHILPVPKPNIVGTLEGNFDFKLERGQAGQPFP